MNFDLREINFAFARNYRWMSDPAKINEGECYIWAYVAYHLIENSILCSVRSLCGCHAFIKINNKYYDSESLDGEEHWQDLKYFKRGARVSLSISSENIRCLEQSKTEFEKFWSYLDGQWEVIYDDIFRWGGRCLKES